MARNGLMKISYVMLQAITFSYTLNRSNVTEVIKQGRIRQVVLSLHLVLLYKLFRMAEEK